MRGLFQEFRATLQTFAVCVFTAAASGQTAATPGNDLKQTLLQARQGFGLETEGSAPFHLKAHFDAFDPKGKLLSSGTLEEYWDGDHRSRLETTYQGASQKVWHTPALSSLGEPLHESYYVRKVVTGFLQPLPPPQALEKRMFEEKDTKAGAVTMHCIISKQTENPDLAVTNGGFSQQDEQAYCLSADDQHLRMQEGYPGLLLVYNKLVKFGSRTIPFSIRLSQNKITRANFEVDTLETWKPDDAVVTPPPDAIEAPVNVRVAGGVIAGNIIEKVQPVYPVAAKMSHIQGSVVLAAMITKAGLVDDLEVISSPDATLSAAAIGAVKHWRYRPYLLNGEPVEVDTTITINFSFGVR